MAKRKSQAKLLTKDEFLAELDRRVEALRRGELTEMEFAEWWSSSLGIKGKGILESFLKQRELARGWWRNSKRKKKSS
ncbi:MAG: hypothetical protein NZ805_09220 [Armatimonadetes bacterium]|nr:hypothetical protein [Armatimonadota bacterium]MDW8029926.1 hypothetical protein [Armatimonadota bacterium]